MSAHLHRRTIQCVVLLTLLSTNVRGASAQDTARDTAGQVEQRADDQRKEQDNPAEPWWFLESSHVAGVPYNDKVAGGQRHWVEVQAFYHLALGPRQNSAQYARWIEGRHNPSECDLIRDSDDKKREAKVAECESDYQEKIQGAPVHNRWSLTLATILRGHDEKSVPIRTPSIIFGSRYQLISHSLDNRDKPKRSRMVERSIGFLHHSDGQDGCTFLSQSRDSEGECVPEPSGKPTDLNLKDGSIGINHVAATLGWADRDVCDTSKEACTPLEITRAKILRVEARAYVPWKLGGSSLQDVDHMHGYLELRGSAQHERPLSNSILKWLTFGRGTHHQFTVVGWQRFAPKLNNGHAVSVDYGIPSFAGGIGVVFVRAYAGNDYYNIRFNTVRKMAMIGVSFQPSRMARLPSPITPSVSRQ